MDRLTLAFGASENLWEDIHILARKCTENPVVVTAQKHDIKGLVVEKASALFIEDSLVLVLIDPEPKVMEALAAQVAILKERIHVIVYSTTQNPDLKAVLGLAPMVLEKERENRIKARVLAMSRQYGKKMTDKAFLLLKERVRDEAFIDMELMKLIDYVGDRKTIESRDVAVTVSAGHEDTLIMLYDALAKREKKEISRIVAHLLGQGLHVLAIHNFLVKQMRLLLLAKDTETLFNEHSEYKLFSKVMTHMKDQVDFPPLDKRQYLPFQKPFYAFTLSKTSAKFAAKELEAFLAFLSSLDLSIKTGTRYEVARLESGLFGM
jgi:DNA polymerase III delta subunit